MENLGRYFVCIQSVQNFKEGKLYRLIYGEENGVIGYNPEFINRFFRDATDKEIQKELGSMKEVLDQRTKETLVVVQQMVNDGQISEEVAERYFPQLKVYKEKDKEDKILKRIELCLEECVHSDVIRDYEKDEVLNWLNKKNAGNGNPYSGVGFNYNNHHYSFCVRDGEINIYIDKQLVGGYTPNFEPIKINNWKPSSKQIEALKILILDKSYGEKLDEGVVQVCESLLNDLKNL